MSEKPFYSKNPITEALIDVQLDTSSNIAINDLKKFSAHLDGKFPTAKERHLIQTTFELAESKPVQAQNIAVEGYEFWNESKTEVIQARRSGYSFSRLRPYETWEKHYPDAMKYLTKFQEVYGPSMAKRLAVRFINLIKIPELSIELLDYFNCAPDTPSALTKMDLESFLYRVVIRFDSTTKAIVTIAPGVPTTTASTIEILLDIDVVADYSVPISGDFTKIFDKLHEYAETIFEAYITEKTRILIK